MTNKTSQIRFRKQPGAVINYEIFCNMVSNSKNVHLEYKCVKTLSDMSRIYEAIIIIQVYSVFVVFLQRKSCNPHTCMFHAFAFYQKEINIVYNFNYIT